MEKREIIVCYVVLVLGLVSFAAGLSADAIRRKDVYSTSHLPIYPRRQALPLGILAAVGFFIAHITIIIENCWQLWHLPIYPSDRPIFSNRAKALIWSGASCITTFISIVMFRVGFEVLLDPENQDILVSVAPWCYYILKVGVFSIGSCSSTMSVLLYLLYYRYVLTVKYTNPVQAPDQIVEPE